MASMRNHVVATACHAVFFSIVFFAWVKHASIVGVSFTDSSNQYLALIWLASALIASPFFRRISICKRWTHAVLPSLLALIILPLLSTVCIVLFRPQLIQSLPIVFVWVLLCLNPPLMLHAGLSIAFATLKGVRDQQAEVVAEQEGIRSNNDLL